MKIIQIKYGYKVGRAGSSAELLSLEALTNQLSWQQDLDRLKTLVHEQLGTVPLHPQVLSLNEEISRLTKKKETLERVVNRFERASEMLAQSINDLDVRKNLALYEESEGVF